ncbi:MAG: nuclear transport factor 2 family protein [Dehalococcoidia bacterium]|nr:MAG: nuclear transport factor 2 family protein [Dehalococcoidia bacterium]
MAGATPEATFRAWAKANVAADMATWATLVTDEFTYVHSSANFETKQQVIDAFNSGRRYHGWDIKEIAERAYEGCRILTGTAALTVGKVEAPNILNLRFTATAVPSPDGWRLAALQTTRLPD